MSLIKIQKIYPIKPQTHSNPTSAIETITDKIKSKETDAIYHDISKSEATNVDRYFITSILNKLKSQNVIPINQQPRATIRKKDPQNVKSQRQNVKNQPDPDLNLFSNQPEPDLVLLNDTTPLVSNTITTANAKQFSNINANEPLTVDKAISLDSDVQSIYFTVTTLEATIYGSMYVKLKLSYLQSKDLILTNKIESISNDFEIRVNNTIT